MLLETKDITIYNVKMLVNQEDVTITTISEFNNRAPKLKKQKLTELNRQSNNNS